MNCPEFWIIAGPNGAGKTTCVQKEPIQKIIADVSFFNPDDRTLQMLRLAGYEGFHDAPEDKQRMAFQKSADEVEAEIEAALKRNDRIGVETVLSTEKYKKVVEDVKSRVGRVYVIYVAVSSPAISIQRVAYRVSKGGHGVPIEKIESRWQKSLELLPWFAEKATTFWIFDNSSANPTAPNMLIASGKNGVLEFQSESTFPEMKATLAKITMKDQPSPGE